MSAAAILRDVIAKVASDYLALYGLPANYWHPIREETHDEVADRLGTILADALLASPALARVIREAKAEAWDEGLLEGVTRGVFRRWPKRPNPYRKEGA